MSFLHTLKKEPHHLMFVFFPILFFVMGLLVVAQNAADVVGFNSTLCTESSGGFEIQVCNYLAPAGTTYGGQLIDEAAATQGGQTVKFKNKGDQNIFIPTKTPAELASFAKAAQSDADSLVFGNDGVEVCVAPSGGLTPQKLKWDGTPMEWNIMGFYNSSGQQIGTCPDQQMIVGGTAGVAPNNQLSCYMFDWNTNTLPPANGTYYFVPENDSSWHRITLSNGTGYVSNAYIMGADLYSSGVSSSSVNALTVTAADGSTVVIGTCEADGTWQCVDGIGGGGGLQQSAHCSGTVTIAGSTAGKVDWNANNFNWDYGNLYRDNNGTPQVATYCGEDLDPGDAIVSGGFNAVACIIDQDNTNDWSQDDYYQVRQFAPGAGYWFKINMNASGNVISIQQQPQMGTISSSTPPSTYNCSQNTTPGSCVTPANATSGSCTWNPATNVMPPVGCSETIPSSANCTGITEASTCLAVCDSDPGVPQVIGLCTGENTTTGLPEPDNGETALCQWNSPAGQDEVVCQDASGSVIADSSCPQPKPSPLGFCSSLCGINHGQTFDEASDVVTTKNCAIGATDNSGQLSFVPTSGTYNWTCSAGGETDSCSATILGGGGTGCTLCTCGSEYTSPQQACEAIGADCYWEGGRYCTLDEADNDGCRSAVYKSSSTGPCTRVACFPTQTGSGGNIHGCF